MQQQSSNDPISITKLISSDTHIIEPPDLWVSRVDRPFRDRAPRVSRIDGDDWWVFDGRRIGSVSGRKMRSGSLSMHAGEIESRGPVLTHSVFEDVDPAAYVPGEYVRTNLADGVVGAVVRPTQGITNYCINDPILFSQICHAYNDWIAEFCSVAPDMLKGVAMLNNYDPKDAVRELSRVQKLGLVAGLISVYPGRTRSYSNAEYDPLWAAAAEASIPISLHVLTNHDGPYGVSFPEVDYSLRANADYWVRLSLSDMIFSGVFEKHPKLRVETAEHEGGWVPYFLWQLDWIYDNRIRRRKQATKLERSPSDYFHNNVGVSIIYDRGAVEARHVIGIKNLMWGSDFPHEQSTHPHSLGVVRRLLSGLPQDEAERIAFRNAATFFGFSLEARCPTVDDGRMAGVADGAESGALNAR